MGTVATTFSAYVLIAITAATGASFVDGLVIESCSTVAAPMRIHPTVEWYVWRARIVGVKDRINDAEKVE